MMQEMSRDEALISMLILSYMRGEVVSGEYRFRLLGPVPKEMAIFGSAGVFYTDNPRELMKKLIRYPPYKHDYQIYERRYVMPEEPINLTYKAERIWIKTYYPTLGDMQVLSMRMHGEKFAEYHAVKDGERYLIYLQKYLERPPWRGLMWKEEDVAGVPMDLIHRAVEIYNESYEKFPPVVFLVKTVRVKEGEINGKQFSLAKIYRNYDINPVLDTDKSGFFVEYKKGNKRVALEYLEGATLDEVIAKVKGKKEEVAVAETGVPTPKKEEKKVRKKGGVEIG